MSLILYLELAKKLIVLKGRRIKGVIRAFELKLKKKKKRRKSNEGEKQKGDKKIQHALDEEERERWTWKTERVIEREK